MIYREPSTTCSTPGCKEPRRAGGRYCRTCHADHEAVYRGKRKQKLEALIAAARQAGIEVTEWEHA